MSQLPESIKEIIRRELKPPMEGWCTPEKGIILAELIWQNRPQLCLESGIFGGRSIVAQGITLKAIGHGVAIGIDPWDIDAATEGHVSDGDEAWWRNNVNIENIYRGFIENIMRLELTKEVRWIRAKSQVASRLFFDKSVNFFHQDSNHSELVSCLEVDTWKSKMADNSIWVMDDSDWPSQARAVKMIQDSGFKMVVDYKTFAVFRNA